MKRYLLVINVAVAHGHRVAELFYPTYSPIFKAVVICLLVINAGSVQAQQSVVAEDTAYINAVNERANKIAGMLGITDASKLKQVQAIIAQQYRALNQLHESSKAVVAGIKKSTTLTKEAIAEAVKKQEEEKEAKLKQQHTAYIALLSNDLSPEQVEKVKDGMTYRVLPITYAAYQDMIPQLTDAQKQQIYAWLTEARDHAMDAESSEKKHWWFGKYKGRINNYLSSEGYDLKKANEDWAKRRNATKTGSPG
ncbi:DUF3826 domain-containing protein [Pseudoflavitalea sp. X16]|uniref:DUF3826 domain-containing protein n=1 Tax=Paraflavitalea devenefica TaxID=2716334 RepID=UPI00142399AD|nr:DUF3826 domain-containing protein [Paraflavitalea devenefica]NII26013.1 DUF3826 domain-containing protein [Paraflavitalea devenefica]